MNYMKNLLILYFFCDSYHYVNYPKTIFGKIQHEKIITSKNREEFKYSSWRDTSGIFKINTGKFSDIMYKFYINLQIDYVYEFTDNFT